jgi:hypothetical protein
MRRIDFHIIKTARGWHLQDAQGRSLKVCRSAADAFEIARDKANALRARGIHARITLHTPGKPPDVFDFAATQG